MMVVMAVMLADLHLLTNVSEVRRNVKSRSRGAQVQRPGGEGFVGSNMAPQIKS